MSLSEKFYFNRHFDSAAAQFMTKLGILVIL